MIKNIIWDFDGTLIDTYPLMIKAFKIALEEKNVSANESEIEKLLKISSEHAISYYQMDDSFKKIWKDEEKKVSKEFSKPFENVIDVLKYVISKGGKNYIVTHRDITTYDFLKYYNMENYFEDILTIEEAEFRKPNDNMFKKLILRNNINVETTLSVGDRILDLIPSMNVGLLTCYYNNENREIDFSPDYTIFEYGELLEILKNKNKYVL